MLRLQRHHRDGEGSELTKRTAHGAPPDVIAAPRTDSLMGAKGWILALLLCLPALVPTIMPGWFEGHDDLHIYRLIELDLAVRDGQIPPRWLPDISAGYGNPHPIYYAPLFYAIAEIFHLAGLTVIPSLKAAIVVVMLVSGLGMFQYARQVWGTEAALVAAAAYTYAPYHILDLYVRKAFSELTVFAFLPFLLLALRNLRSRGSRWDIVAGALAMAAVMTSHTISTMLVPPLVGAYALFLHFRVRPAQGATRAAWLARCVVSLGTGAALAGFFIVPAFLERNLINLRIYTEAYVDYHKHFVYPQQLLWWPWGFGMSLDGLADKMSFRMGLLQIAGTALTVIRWRRLRSGPRAAAEHALFYLAMTVVAVFMMIPASSAVWGILPPLKFVQFPWRFLTLTTLSTAILCAAAFVAFVRARPGVAAMAIVALFPLSAAAGGMLAVNLRIPVDRVGFTENPYNQMVDRGPEAASSPETMDADFVRRHTLRWIDHLPPGVSFMGLDRTDLERPRVQVERGSARVSEVAARTWRTDFRVETETPALVRVNTYRFPGWTVRIDGAQVPIVEVPRQRKVIFFDVAPGRHEVQVVFERTPARRLGDFTTLAGLAMLACLGLWPAKPPA
ncbi:MAG TPA: 6-pyruvoyl-tetrahydropterin synthase-related protein [Candidatus Polarisedimenticolia bacterium]|nr:6-pyruvoyl-tetrahydropterin synthase-related protein [Candidatus Polarisedimenticolia bacterium]